MVVQDIIDTGKLFWAPKLTELRYADFRTKTSIPKKSLDTALVCNIYIGYIFFNTKGIRYA